MKMNITAHPRTAGRPRPNSRAKRDSRRPRVTANSSRKGSAILIVLGMLSFMVVSAVGFAVYMRQSRLPSSYLRRASSTRYLLKAALAHAIARLDGCEGKNGNGDSRCEGVYDDVYPGVGRSQNESIQNNGDNWAKRVFMPFGQVSPDNTVSTLSLEALAYLPPAVINDVRVYSRRTRTAQWQNLSYDAGRYAFCAVDVSDCFDLNKLYAGQRRSSAPGRRVNLSSLFPNNGDQLDDIIEQCSRNAREVDQKGNQSNIPFVSMADFNLVAQGTAFSPWTRFVKSGNDLSIYNAGDRDSVENALFITDTWFPSTNTTTITQYNLSCGGENQPFKQYSQNASMLESAQRPTKLSQTLQKNLGGIGLACLYDYLDQDSVPVSYVLPTVETAPMVTGVGLVHGNQFAPTVVAVDNDKKTGDYPDPQDAKATIKWTAVPYKLKSLFTRMGVSGSAVFPFKRAATKGYDTDFKGEVLMKICLAEAGLADTCRLSETSDLGVQTKSDWKDSGSNLPNGVLSCKGTISALNFGGDIGKTQDAAKEFAAAFTGPSFDVPVYWQITQVKETKDENGNISTTAYGDPYVSFAGCGNANSCLAPRDSQGQVAAWWKSVATTANIQAGNGIKPPENHSAKIPTGTKYIPHVFVWVKLMSGSDVVDIVPACIRDDQIWGNKSNIPTSAQENVLGWGTPLLAFHGDNDFVYGQEQAGTPDPFSSWTKLFTVDPRYNFAPENWFACAGGDGNITQTEWLDKIGATGSGGVLGQGSEGIFPPRDRDIFMFTSDQEYLQSIQELAFLPFLQDLNGAGEFFEGTYKANSVLNGNGFAKGNRVMDKPTDRMGAFGMHKFFWRTYSPMDDDLAHFLGPNGDVEIVSGAGDFRVNPFSPDRRVLMAALKDTPFDWYVASTNKNLNETYNMTPSQRKSWAFCDESTVAKLTDDELEDIADHLRGQFAQGACEGRTSWEEIFDDLAWYENKRNDEQKGIFGLADLTEPLHGVDRKFLYGFWRECFQNRQQLFLVFIRAEALTVGGSGSHALGSSQLGARGVALVWRDPAPPKRGNRPSRNELTSANAWTQYHKDNAPHRTRVLFYHQFD